MDIRRRAPAETIWLADFIPGHGKYRQILAYILADRPLLTDWSQDNYIAPFLPPGAVRGDPSAAAWTLTPPGEFRHN